MTTAAMPLFLLAPGRTEAELGAAMSAAVFCAGRAFHRTGAHDTALLTEAFAAACDYVDHLGPAFDDRELAERDTFQDLRSEAEMTALPMDYFAAARHCNKVRMYRGDTHLQTG